MKSRRQLHLPLLIAALTVLQSCGMFPGDNEIDPAGGLERSDYIQLRHREGLTAAETPLPQTPPRIPDMHVSSAVQAPAAPGDGKLVSVSVTDSMPLRD